MVKLDLNQGILVLVPKAIEDGAVTIICHHPKEDRDIQGRDRAVAQAQDPLVRVLYGDQDLDPSLEGDQAVTRENTADHALDLTPIDRAPGRTLVHGLDQDQGHAVLVDSDASTTGRSIIEELTTNLGSSHLIIKTEVLDITITAATMVSNDFTTIKIRTDLATEDPIIINSAITRVTEVGVWVTIAVVASSITDRATGIISVTEGTSEIDGSHATVVTEVGAIHQIL